MNGISTDNKQFEEMLSQDLKKLNRKLNSSQHQYQRKDSKISSYLQQKYPQAFDQMSHAQNTADRFRYQYQKLLYNMTSKQFVDITYKTNFIKENIKNPQSNKRTGKRQYKKQSTKVKGQLLIEKQMQIDRWKNEKIIGNSQQKSLYVVFSCF
ncbi:UNKNOWN [Stylonychia lemnae]|uniref:Uncharacterized protein n=1 Tax=Stylonychia lemnae TaxID=5949 RepID=A0A078AH76_STYLE|nr:UNKNOWN [Stylonychia lemnae]|eukprot:CDW80867.1 UNKNOWN [Stylonychia lemnae]